MLKSKYAPYAHQLAALEKLKRGPCALFMDMGTGKSKTVLDFWVYLNQIKPTDLVIVYPSSIRTNWEGQLATHIDGVYNKVVWGNGKWHRRKEFDVNAPTAYLVNVEAFALPRDVMLAPLKAYGHRLVVVDESSTIKNPKAKRTKNILATFSGPHNIRTVMTGTEISNTILDLFTQFEFIKPGFFGDDKKNFNSRYWDFSNRYAVWKDSLANGRRYRKLIGFTRMNELMEKIAPHTYRVTRDECLDLPGFQDIEIIIEMSAEQKRTYKELKKQFFAVLESGDEVSVKTSIAQFSKLRQVSGPGMIIDDEYKPFLEDAKTFYLLQELEDTSEKVIIFCEYRHEVEAVAKALGPEAVRYMGGESQDVIKEFTENPEKRFFVGTSASGGMGLNLQCAALVYFFSVGPSYVLHEQAKARIYRAGQTRKCVYKYLLASPMDKHLLKLVREKKNLHDAIKEGPAAVRALLEGEE